MKKSTAVKVTLREITAELLYNKKFDPDHMLIFFSDNRFSGVLKKA